MMLRKVFKIALSKLKDFESLAYSFVTFFLDEKSNQKSQVRVEILKFLLKTPSARKKLNGFASLKQFFASSDYNFAKT